MKLNAFIAALAVAATGAAALPAVAQAVSAGDAQLARSLDVAPGALSRSQLIRLEQARENGGAQGRATTAFILAQDKGVRVSTSGTDVSATNRAILLQNAVEEGDTVLIALRSGSSQNATSNDQQSTSPGKVQLAASLGLNATDHTTSELVAIQTKRIFEDNSK